MWINKIVYQTLISAWNEQLADLHREIDAAQGSIRERDAQIDQLHADIRRLRHDFIAAEGAKRAAQAMCDLLTVQFNHAHHERGEFLAKLLDPAHRPEIQVPKISQSPVVMPPGVEFEDMGDIRARHEGHGDPLPVDPLTRVDDVEGLVGRVYDPASALGSELPRLGDDVTLHPDA